MIELPNRSLWLDESASFAISSQHGSALWAAMRHDGGNMLAFYAVLHVLMGWFGQSTWVLRLPAAISAAISVSLVAAVAGRLCGRGVGAAAGLIAAVSLPLVYWGQDARAYAPMVACVCASYLGFVWIVDGAEAPPRSVAWALYVVALVLGAYMSFVSLLVVPAQLLVLAVFPAERRRLVRPLVVALVVVGAACLPLAWIAHARGSGQLFWVNRPDWQSSAALVQTLLSSGLTPSFRETATSVALFVLTLVVLAAATVVAVLRGWGRGREGDGGAGRWRFAGVLVAGWVVVPPLLILLESLVGQSIYEARYALISMPGVAVALAWAVLRTGLPRWLALAALAVLVVLRGQQIVPTYGVSPENWAAAAAYVRAHSEPGDCIAFYPSDGRMAFQYYAAPGGHVRSGVPRPVLPSESFHRATPFVEDYATLDRADLRAVSRACQRLWVVSSHVGHANGTPGSRLHYERFVALSRQLRRRYPTVTSTRFGYASTIKVARYGR